MLRDVIPYKEILKSRRNNGEPLGLLDLDAQRKQLIYAVILGKKAGTV